ncbi:Retinoic acid induced 16-like protein-domain-containing protein [Delphinella strobiligena]|nr:Retinoic acid induced 16-like protein-domain-containing protein [Delphinella strobiligena]
MDFWSRLIGGTSKPKSSPAQTPQQRLQRFRRAYSPILQLCSRPQLTAANRPALDQLRVSLARIAAILREESRTPAPHLCLAFAASAQIYSVIARSASTSQNEAVIREAIAVFSILVDCEEEDFLASPVFAKSLIRFAARVTTSASIGDDTETDLIEVLFGVAAKIRMEPDILPVWFKPTSRPPDYENRANESKSFAGATQKEDFPLCYQLIDRIHHEGRIGDFARTGLLYLFDAVSHSPDLKEWIIGSDLPTLMASGLGALYSQLSRELSIRHPSEHLPIMLALSDYDDLQPAATAENIFSHSHANYVSTFLSHLAFWQDVLEHCNSDDVKQTLLDHFQVLFLQQLLYPSLLQSSDTDGGSSVAVLTYVAVTLEALDHPDLVHMVLHYLLAMPDAPTSTPHSHPSPALVQRQSSLTLLDDLASDEEKVDPNLFSLVDLILNGVKSQNPQTAVCALKLSSVLLNRHTDYAVSTLVKAYSPPNSADRRTAGALSAESEALMNIASSLSYEESLDDAYATALLDVVPPLELQMIQQIPPSSVKLSSSDPFLVAISSLFRSFFTNNVDVNLALTETVMQLALRTQISLDGWLTVSPSNYQSSDDDRIDLAIALDHLDDDEKLAFQSLRSAHRRPRWEQSQAPVLPSLLHNLELQINDIRRAIPNLDTLIAKRIEILSGVEKDEPPPRPESRPQISRLSSDVGTDSIRSNRTGVPRQVQRLKTDSAANSRQPSPAPSRVRDVGGSPSRNDEPLLETSSPNPTLGRLSHGLDSSADTFQYIAERQADQQPDEEYEEREASASHVLTNIVILHYFLLELVAVLQTRAIMFDEVVFS